MRTDEGARRAHEAASSFTPTEALDDVGLVECVRTLISFGRGAMAQSTHSGQGRVQGVGDEYHFGPSATSSRFRVNSN